MNGGKGQFSIIAALLVAAVLVATLVMTYSMLRISPIQVQPQILSTIDETNLALKEILGFTIGYYGSVLKVTGNSTYAKELAINYAKSGLESISRMHPELGASFNLSSVDLSIYWYSNCSWSRGRLAVNYSLAGLGLYGMRYETSCELKVQVKELSTNQTRLLVTREGGEPLLSLTKQNFKFYSYSYGNSTWVLVNPSREPTADTNGTYTIDMNDPALANIDKYSYVVQVEDPRGLLTVVSSFSRYALTLSWNSTLYAPLRNAIDATIVVELLQNGTMRWLGQNLQLTTQAKPVPPIPVKAIRVNQTTINGVNQEVPFQIEDWASDYKIPLGLTSNASIFSNRHMLVFLVNPNVTKVTIWWNGSDTTVQTPYAYVNRYFNDDINNRRLSNRILTLQFSSSGFTVTATVGGGVSNTANLMRINGEEDNTDPEWGWTLYSGVVRDIVQGEPEYGGGVSNPACYNFYAHVVITLPANATYYTYQLRLIFLDSADKPRTINDLCLIRLSTTANVYAFTENGTLPSGYPMVSSGYNLFYNMSGVWQHRWSQLNASSGGFGIMFPDASNKMLYYFDAMTTNGNPTGALRINQTTTGWPTYRIIELLPVSSLALVNNFASASDICWYGAVVTFNTNYTPIYKGGGASATGLWVLVEYPPTITVTTES
ncbi:MAG: hypothetical protein QXI91_02750 [Candidatus Bathyarchaeia archaeon]